MEEVFLRDIRGPTCEMRATVRTTWGLPRTCLSATGSAVGAAQYRHCIVRYTRPVADLHWSPLCLNWDWTW